MTKQVFVISLVFICSMLFAKTPKQTTIYKANAQSDIILVAVLKGAVSPFKDALIDSLQSRYGNKYKIKKILLKNPNDLAKEQYRLLIVMDKLKANLMMNGKIKNIKKTTDINNTIYVLTTGDPKWKWQNNDVHHVASASEKPRISTAWKELKTKVDKLLN